MRLPEKSIVSKNFFKNFLKPKISFWMEPNVPLDAQKILISKNNFIQEKKRPTRKNLILTDPNKKVLVVTPTVRGHHHDYTMFKESGLPEALPEDIYLWLALGFQGIKNDFPQLKVIIPDKKPKGKELTEAQKVLNTMRASTRILAEHAIAGIKRLNSVSQTFRNHLDQLNDQFMRVAAGIWNLHLEK